MRLAWLAVVVAWLPARALPPAALVPVEDGAAARYYQRIGDALLSWGRDEAAFHHYREGLLRKPDDLRCRVHIARVLFRLGQPELALEEARKAVGHDARDPEAQRVLGGILLFSDQPEEAAEVLAPVVAAHRDDGAAHRLLGLSYLRLERVPQAEQALRAATRLNPRDGEAWARLASIELARGRRLAAIPLLRRAVEADPNNTPALRTLADLCTATKRYQEALDLVLQVSAATPDDPQPLIVAGNLLLQLQQVDRAAVYFRRAYDSGVPEAVAPAAAMLAEYAASRNRYREVVTYCQRLLALEPQAPAPRVKLVEAYRVLGHWGAAADACAPLAASPRADPRLWLQWLDLQLRAGRRTQAARTGEGILRRWPRDVPLAGQVVEGMVVHGRLDLAEGFLREATARYPQTPQYGYMLYSTLRRTHRAAQAAAVLADLLRRYPREPLPRREQGLLLYEQRRYGEAAAVLDGLLRAEQLDVEGGDALAWALAFDGRHERALAVRRWLVDATGDPRRWLAVGRELEALDADTDAEAVYRNLLRAQPRHVPAMLALAGLLAAQGQVDEALVLLQEATTREPRSLPAWRGYSLLLAGAGRYAEARAALERYAALNPRDPTVAVARGEVEAALSGDVRGATKVYEAALRKLTGSPTLRCRLGDTYLAAAEDYERAIKQYAAAARLAPGDWYPRLQLSAIHERRGDWAAAAGSWRDVLAVLPESEPSYDRWLACLARSGAPRLALEAGAQWLGDHRTAFAQAPCLVDLATRQSQLPALQDRLGKLLAARPDTPALRDAYGLALLGQGRSAEALSWYETAARDGRHRGRWLWRRGQAEEAQGRLEDAWRSYQAAARLLPDDRAVLERLARVEVATGRVNAGLQTLHRLIAADPSDLDAFERLIRLYHAEGRLADVLPSLEALVLGGGDQQPRPGFGNSPEVLAALALANELLGRRGEALVLYGEALARHPRLLAAKAGILRLRDRPAWLPPPGYQPQPATPSPGGRAPAGPAPRPAPPRFGLPK